jgi:NO-binding membrane sensor protein with MHYT domain
MNSSDMVMVASHNPILVGRSVAVSIFAAYATIALIQRLRDARSWLWLAWLVSGGVADTM